MPRIVAALILFGVSFGYLEAAVVVYLRAIYDPLRERIHPGRQPNQLFPLISPEQLAAAGPAGALAIVLAFIWDYRNTTSGGFPNAFNWPLFAAGEAIGIIAFLAAARRREYPGSQRPHDY